MQKVSTLIGITIIVAAAIIFYGGAFVYQYLAIEKLNSQLQIGALSGSIKSLNP